MAMRETPLNCGLRNETENSKLEIEGGKIEITTRYSLPNQQSKINNQQSKINNQQSKGFIELLVRDNGCGIPADKLDRIFDPFFTTKEVGKGTGLGLSISYGIIKDHGGEIAVAETGPDGTTMRVRLPVEREREKRKTI